MDEQKQAIEAILGQFWDERAVEMGDAAQSTEELGAPLDSLTSMEALLEIDRVLKRTVPVDAVIQKVGYNTREQFIDEITTKVLKFVAENPQ